MPSFDIVSKLDLAEVDNAIHQAYQEISQRYDFKDTASSVARAEKVVTLESADEYKVKAAYEVLQGKLVRRSVSLKAVKAHDVEPAAKGRARMVLDLIDGIEIEKARELVKKIKAMNLKVQASIQEEQVRVSAKKKDDLQKVIGVIRALDFPVPLQIANFRD
ncbi:MAG: YajQ family cyclic di-GMP-binding protein [Pseudomonadota bacterium]